MRTAVDARGLARARWEIPRYRLPLNSNGEESDLPIKIDDDWIDQLKALADEFFPPPGAMPYDDWITEKLKEMNPALDLERILKMPPEGEYQMAMTGYK